MSVKKTDYDALAGEGSCVSIMSAGAAIAPSCETCTHAAGRPDRQEWYLWTEIHTGMCQWHVACPLRPHETASGLRHINPGYTQTWQRVLAVISSTSHEEDRGGTQDIH